MNDPNYPEGVTDRDIDRIGEPIDGGDDGENGAIDPEDNGK